MGALGPNWLLRTHFPMTLQDVTEMFFVHVRVENNYAPETQDKIQECYRSWLLPRFGSRSIEEIQQLDILQLRQAMAARRLSNSRQSNILIALRLCLRFCRKTLGVNCLDPGSIPLPRRTFPQVQYLTNEEIQAVRANIDTLTIPGIRLRALMEILLASGMRISEALGLNRDSINPDELEAKVVGKGGHSRVVFFTPEAFTWLSRYLDRRMDLHPALFVTTSKVPQRLRRGDIPRYFKAVGKAAGVTKHFTPHLLRHTFCTNLRNNGADISLIKHLAGHRDIQTTARYYLAPDKQVLHQAVRKYLNYAAKSTAPAITGPS